MRDEMKGLLKGTLATLLIAALLAVHTAAWAGKDAKKGCSLVRFSECSKCKCVDECEHKCCTDACGNEVEMTDGTCVTPPVARQGCWIIDPNCCEPDCYTLCIDQAKYKNCCTRLEFRILCDACNRCGEEKCCCESQEEEWAGEPPLDDPLWKQKPWPRTPIPSVEREEPMEEPAKPRQREERPVKVEGRG
jgi:hypothetical protein